MNPYNWRGHRPRVEIARPEVRRVVANLCDNGSAVVLAGRGLGKSVFLRQLRAELDGHPEVRTVLFETPPPDLTVTSCIEELADKLGVSIDKPNNTYKVIEAYLRQPGAAQQVVLLYDEFDRYAHSRISPAHPPGRDFFNNLESMRRDFTEVGILAAGSIGVFVFRDDLGSSFLARAEQMLLKSFSRADLEELARPFSEDGRPLSDEVFEALVLSTGGHPALVTYGLESLWPLVSPTSRDVVESFVRFRDRHGDFLRDFRRSFSSPKLSDVPQRTWDLIQSKNGEVSHEELRQACIVPEDSILDLDFADVLDLLRAASLIQVIGSIHTDPVNVRPIPSIMSLPSTTRKTSSLRDQLCQDIGRLLEWLHSSAADFFRSGAKGQGKQLLPEATFSVMLALGLSQIGWQVEREAQLGAGRTDLKLRWTRTGEGAVVEVKLWGRNDYEEVHRQVESYWSTGIRAGGVVMITDAEIVDWPEVYRKRCFEAFGLTAETHQPEDSPIRAILSCVSTTPDEMTAFVDHFLIRLPRRS